MQMDSQLVFGGFPPSTGTTPYEVDVNSVVIDPLLQVNSVDVSHDTTIQVNGA
jgi:hypothetical protein